MWEKRKKEKKRKEKKRKGKEEEVKKSIFLSRMVCGMCDHFHRTFHIPAAKQIYIYIWAWSLFNIPMRFVTQLIRSWTSLPGPPSHTQTSIFSASISVREKKWEKDPPEGGHTKSTHVIKYY